MNPLNVRDFGAVGDGITDDTEAIQAALDAAYGAYGHGVEFHLNRAVFIPAGQYLISSPLRIVNTWGAHVYGEGMVSTAIINGNAADPGCFVTNGVGYSTFGHMQLRTLPGGIGFDYNWDNTGMSGQLNTFYKMSFEGGAYGCRVGVGGHMCDTSTWIDCAFLNATEAGLLVGNLNSMAHRVIGGNFQGNRIGIYVTAGAVQSIVGAGFQASKEWDIKLDGGATDTYAITGISTESTNFVTARNVAIGLTLVGCAQRSTSPGTFVAGAGMVHIEGCWSLQGIVTSGNNLTAKNCFFNRHDANYYSGPVPVVKIDNCLFGDSINSVARRDVDVVVTPAGRRTHRIEGATLTDASVVNGGVNINLEGGSNSVPVVVSIADPAVVILAWHGFSAGVPVAFTTTGELPTGLRTTVTYYVLADGLTTDRFRISASAGGSAIATSGSQSGTHSIYLVRVFTVGDQILNSGVAAGGSPGWICTTAGPALGVAVFKPMANVAA